MKDYKVRFTLKSLYGGSERERYVKVSGRSVTEAKERAKEVGIKTELLLTASLITKIEIQITDLDTLKEKWEEIEI